MTLTEAYILILFALTILYTCFAQSFGQKTISQTIRDVSWNWSAFPYIWGMLIAHWLFPTVNYVTESAFGYALIGAAGALIVDLTIDDDTKWLRPWWRYPGLWFVIGCVNGLIFWSQKF